MLLGFSVVRSENEQVWGMSSFAFGMILVGAGVVAYFINHALRPAGWSRRRRNPLRKKGQSAAGRLRTSRIIRQEAADS